MRYDFDERIDRRNTDSVNVEGWRKYIFANDPEKIFSYADDEMIRMWVADMEFSVAPEIRLAISDRLDQKIFGYTKVFDSRYYDAFQKWCIDKYGWRFNKEELIFSSGIVPALYQAVEDLVAPDEKVLTLTPAYGHFAHACTYNRVELVRSDLVKMGNRFFIDFDDLEKKAADPKMKLLMLCNPHNPTGRIWQDDELRRIAEIVEKYDLWIISDEIHCDLLRSELRHTTMGTIMPDYKKLIVMMSASKSFNLAGLILSNIIIRDAEERERFQLRDKNHGLTNPLSIAAHRAAYEYGALWLDELRRYLDDNFAFVDEFLKKHIPNAGFTIPEATYLAWIDLSGVLPKIADLTLFFADAGVLLESGDSLFVDNAQGYIRLNLAMPRALLKEGLDRIKAAIDKENAAG